MVAKNDYIALMDHTGSFNNIWAIKGLNMTTHRYTLTLNDTEASLLFNALHMYEEDALRKMYPFNLEYDYELYQSRAESAFRMRQKLSKSAVQTSCLHVNIK